jgi:Bacterial SH3 domain
MDVNRLCLAVLLLFLSILIPSRQVNGADSPPVLTARESGVALYARQDEETDRIGTLEKGEALFPIAESVGTGIWYMVRTKQGTIGWVRGSDVVLSSQTKEAFREKQLGSSTWAARTGDGKTFNGTWTVAPNSSQNAASGWWTLSDGNGAPVMRGSWTAEKHATGWNGVWRAAIEGGQGEHTGSWSAEFSHMRNARFAELFEAAAKEAIRGLWTGGNDSGSWAIRAYK